MRWFRCPDPKLKSMLEAKAALGDAGVWQIACLINEAHQQDVWELDVETIIGWIKVKRDRANKILPFAQKIFEESSEIFGKTSKISSKSQENLSKSKDFTPSNPHGSTRDQEREEQIRKEESPSKSPKGDRDKKPFCLPKDWEPNQELLTWALENYSSVDTRQQTERFKNHYLANGKKMADWDRKWQDWIARSIEFEQPGKAAQPAKMAHWQILIDSERIQHVDDPCDIRCGRDYHYGMTGYQDENDRAVAFHALINKHDPNEWIKPEHYKALK